jgi:acyl-CoA synthetase (AMP-forming)/AMP-acid ligase II
MHAPLIDHGGTVAFAAGLRDHSSRLAVSTGVGSLTYDQLADRVDAAVERLGTVRRLVLLAATNDLDTLVAYLAALRGGHPVLLAAADNQSHLDALAAAYDPDVVASTTAEGLTLQERRAGSAHGLHPDLALLLSTSGTTGSSKLVRLSHRNLDANAGAIAEYLAITDTDRAATTLPMHYCYGLSVINSHLQRGAGLALTDLSVVDGCFWDRFRAAGATSFAGVPYTFDLLNRVGFDEMSLPTLRYVTQAGGRLAPDRVRHYADLGERCGWDFYVMYGQTEATARMAYLPPHRAQSHPTAIGVPIPGGSFRIAALDGTDDADADAADGAVGELVYRGPNVMLGYAERAGDLALGRTVDELATGDLARRHPDGVYELVGRRSRFVKLFGLRVDLDHVEAVLRQHGIDALCAGTDETLAIAVAAGVDAGHASRVASKHTGLPPSRTQVATVAELPRLATGKPDYPAVTRLVTATSPEATASPAPARTMTSSTMTTSTMTTSARTGRVRTLFASVLGCAVVDDGASFVSLDGDSLSYVEMSIRLED